MKIGIIGGGHMGGAMIRGMAAKGVISKRDMIIFDKNKELLETLSNETEVAAAVGIHELAEVADVIIMAVNPQFIPSVVEEMKDCIDDSKIIISVALGQTIEKLESYFGKPVKLVRAMPNTPALVGEAITAVAANAYISEEEFALARRALEGFGTTEVLAEPLMEAAVAVSGSSPAYVYMFIEAMADGAVLDGMPRDVAYKFAAQAVLGSAKMVLETGMHPGALKDAVCTPGGSTIEAVRVLEEKGLRSAVIEGMKACTDKAKGFHKK